VVVDGVEDENRWLVDIDTANTYIWLNLDWSAEQSVTLDGAIGSGDTVTTITANEDISGFPGSGILLINSEAFTYTGRSIANKQFTGVTRAANDTTAAAHSDSDDVYWIQKDVWLYYGDESASAPSTDDDYKPVIELDTSTNGSWVYQEFGEDDGLRTGAWTSQVISGKNTPDFYNGNQDSAADPWDELGVDCTTNGSGGRWVLYNPCRLTNANFTNGEKRSSSKANFDARIEGSTDGSSWVDEYYIPDPAADNAWEAWSRDEALGGRVYLGFSCRTSGAFDNKAEVADCTVTLSGSYQPVHTVNSEGTNEYDLDCTITNNTSGDAISLAYSGMDLDGELEVDTDAKTVVDLGDSSKQMQALALVGGARRQWLPLEAGDNELELEYPETGAAGVTVTVEFEKRYYS
jgi:hypothetical protein